MVRSIHLSSAEDPAWFPEPRSGSSQFLLHPVLGDSMASGACGHPQVPADITHTGIDTYIQINKLVFKKNKVTLSKNIYI